MAETMGSLTARVDQQQMQIVDLATQVDNINHSLAGLNMSEMRAEIIDTFKGAQARIKSLDEKFLILEQEMDKVHDAAKQKVDKGKSLVDGK